MSTVSPRSRRARGRGRGHNGAPSGAPVGAATDGNAVRQPVPQPLVEEPAREVLAGSFDALGLPAKLCAVLDKQGLTTPLPIQSATVADALAGRDVLGQAATGSGKTLAFALPLVARLMTAPKARGRGPRALVIAPTRELASQINAVVKPLATAAGLRTATVFGGVGAGPQIAALRAGTEIIIGCPGRLVDHLDHRALDLGNVEVCVIDEADHMADVGFLPMVNRLLAATPAEGQRLLFSATLADGVDVLVRRFLHDPVTHSVSAGAAPDVDHHVVVIDSADRIKVLVGLVGDGRGVVFTRTKHRARQLTRTLNASGLSAVELHGNLSQNARTANLRAFSTGGVQVLVATDIAARGIHVDDVPLVVHADPPIEHRAYLHRSGRTARAGASGTVVTLATPDQIGDVESLLRKAKLSAEWDNRSTEQPGDVRAPQARTSRPSGTGRRPGGPGGSGGQGATGGPRPQGQAPGSRRPSSGAPRRRGGRG